MNETVSGQVVRSMNGLHDIVERILSFEQLPENWNSYGGVPPTHQAIEQAVAVVTEADSIMWTRHASSIDPREVAPLADGGISIVWQGSGGELDVEIEASGQIGYLFEPVNAASGSNIDRADASLQDTLAMLQQTFTDSKVARNIRFAPRA